MKNKGQQHFSSEADAKEKLIVYVYEYLIHSGAKQAAEIFKENIGYAKEIKVNEGPGFLNDWWCVFWDLYCATTNSPEKRNQPEPSNEARAFHEYNMRTVMSPSVTQTSPQNLPPHHHHHHQHQQQQQQQHAPPPQFMGGPRYGPPRAPPPRMQGAPPPPGPSPQHIQSPGGSHPGIQQTGFMPASGPRYSQHPNGPPPPPPQQQQHGPPPQHQVMMGFGGPNPDIDQIGHSPGLNRMTPVAGPPGQISHVGRPQAPLQQVSGPPPSVGPPQSPMVGMSVQQQQQQQHMVSTPPHSQDEYVMPGPFGQDTSDQFESAEILKLKQSMQEDTTKMFEKEQSEFSLGDYSDGQNKWQQ